MDVLWFLPTHGDGRYLGTTDGARAVDLFYLRQIAQAADALGYYGVLLPTGRSCEDAWVVASAMVPLTQRLRFLVALRPGIVSPTNAARMTSTLDRLSGGRVLVNVVTGGDPTESEGDGVFLSHDARYAATAEFLQVYKRVLAGETVDYEGAAHSRAGREMSLPSGAGAASPALSRRIVGRGPRCRGRRGRRLPHVGRAAGRRRRQGPGLA